MERSWDGNSARDSWPRENPREIILRLAAYRATHGGREPPRNSLLTREKESLQALLPRGRSWSRLSRLLRFLLGKPRKVQDPAGGLPRGRPLRRFLIERAFLTDDFREEDVVRRLEAWPMVTAYRPEGRALTGEWFAYTVEVEAESRRQARLLLDFIMTTPVPAPTAAEGADLNPPEA